MILSFSDLHYFLINFSNHFYSEFYVMNKEVLVVEHNIILFFLEEKQKKHRLSSDSNKQTKP